MSFRDELRRLRDKEAAEAAARQRDWEEQQKREEARARQIEETFGYLEEAVRERLKPMIDAIDEVYLNRTGKISFSRQEVRKDKQSYGLAPEYELRGYGRRCYVDGVPAVAISLEWGFWSTGSSRVGSAGGKKLTIVMDKTEWVILADRHSSTVMARVAVDDPNWQAKVENALLHTITSDKCKWSESWDNTP